MLNFTINKQVLKMDGDLVVADSIKYITAKFQFSEDWDGYYKVMHVKKGGLVYDFPIADTGIEAEDNFSLTQGKWEIYLHGVKGESRITTTSVFLWVEPFTNLNGEMYPSVPQSVLDRLMLILQLDGDGTKYLSDDGTYRPISVSEEVVAAEVEKYLKEHPISGITEEQCKEIVADYVTEHHDELKGDKGDTGAQGPKGDTGEQGPAGKDGADGKDGVNGKDGAPGAKGDKGDTGEQGPQGIQGIQGPKGDTGAKGDKGDTGAKGDTGEKGEQGIPGNDYVITTADYDAIADVVLGKLTIAESVAV